MQGKERKMKSKRKYFLFILILASLFLSSSAHSQEDETPLFTSMAPDALIVLDLSGSMRWIPAGERMYTHNLNSCDSNTAAFYSYSDSGHDKACDIDPLAANGVPRYSDASCSGLYAYYRIPGSDHTADCSRLAIAKRAIFDILDDNNDGTIDSSDERNLNIRFGYMRFYNCSGDDAGGDYNSGCNTLVKAINSRYSRIYCNSASSCTITSSSSPSVSSESATGSTPLASALHEAKLYLDAHKATDSAGACRKKFVILITDGSDTLSCSGNGWEDQTDQYKRRRMTVARAKALADAGYKVFVVGFGQSMPHWLRNTLNWAAFYGGTDNPQEGNSVNTSAYDPSLVADCQSDTTDHHDIDGEGDHYFATSNDPGERSLPGYAFFASSATELTDALKQAVEMIRGASYSFSTASVSSQRTIDENYIYEASFDPVENDPFWRGHIKKYNIDPDGNVGSLIWDAGSALVTKDASTRNIFTYKSGALTAFSASNITKQDLEACKEEEECDSYRLSIIGFIRGESAYNVESWKLGDIFHSNPITIGTPSPFYEDNRDTNHAFTTFRQSHERSTANGLRIIIAGSNEGQFHSFKTLDGSELWSFIPPNFLTKLKNISHSAHPTGLTHQYFVDGPVSAYDVWLGTGVGSYKLDSDWKTLVVFGEGRGGGSTLWSSSPSCDSGFNPTYTATYSKYCGYYAFDFSAFSETTNPIYLWRINPTSAQAPYLGEPWSKVVMGRVKINGMEKWVGFFGAGYNASDCAGGGGCDARGKGFYVVDLSNGDLLWSYTRGNDSSMNYSLPASPAIVDSDNDGFIDTAYIGDLGGSMWRFKFCGVGDGDTCNTSSWSGARLFEASSGVIRPIFTTASAARDLAGNLWVDWGTGDKADPTASNAQEKFYGVKDNNRSGTSSINDLDNITTGTYTDSPTKRGWYMNFAGQGEKVLSEPAIFGGVVYLSTYTPPSGGDPCAQAGEAKLYGLEYTTGAGIIPVLDGSGNPTGTTTRSMSVGVGIPSSPILSLKPIDPNSPVTTGSIADLYMTTSGGGGQNLTTSRVNLEPPSLANRTNLTHWKDLRLE
jgi:Tfp pilus tip-associated adhesin PilY1